jgi:hypothetical protein
MIPHSLKFATIWEKKRNPLFILGKKKQNSFEIEHCHEENEIGSRQNSQQENFEAFSFKLDLN